MPEFNEQQEERLHAAAHEMFDLLCMCLEDDDTQLNPDLEGDIMYLLKTIRGYW